MTAAIRPPGKSANCVGGPARAGPVLSPCASGAGYHGTTKSRSSQAMAWASDRLSITWRQKAP
jgi:hypothetical protein